MIDSMNKQMKDAMGPLQEMMRIQTNMLELLAKQQMECTQSCVEATMAQTKELPNCSKPEDVVKLQQAYAKEIEETLRQAGQRNMDILNEARVALTELAQKSMKV
ncbi:flavodoxin [Pokkaliibacter plantistimulans]|uniref:Flavodoxin n=2 Tax=Pseudomonadota TaxID=1224 RepID=A0ABX5LRD7_9GAMM|nr:phasin family protein [Pokkaliibacter plantistimulans]PPC75851.1 flavodoxin [Pokkaliibacter plantistimulans]PXF29212.1 flavodoxin [Pokkaliibacter plantistimulans]